MLELGLAINSQFVKKTGLTGGSNGNHETAGGVPDVSAMMGALSLESVPMEEVLKVANTLPQE